MYNETRTRQAWSEGLGSRDKAMLKMEVSTLKISWPKAGFASHVHVLLICTTMLTVPGASSINATRQGLRSNLGRETGISGHWKSLDGGAMCQKI